MNYIPGVWRANERTATYQIETRKILDEETLTEMRQDVARGIEIYPASSVIIDFERVEYFSSAGLGLLILAKKEALQRNKTLKLRGINPQIKEIFRITGLNGIFDIEN